MKTQQAARAFSAPWAGPSAHGRAENARAAVTREDSDTTALYINRGVLLRGVSERPPVDVRNRVGACSQVQLHVVRPRLSRLA